MYRKLRRGCGRGYPPRTMGTFLDFGVNRFWWVVRLKITLTLAPNVHNDYRIRGDGFSCKVMYLTPRRRVWGRCWILGY